MWSHWNLLKSKYYEHFSYFSLFEAGIKLKLNLRNVFMVRKPCFLTYEKFVFLDRVSLNDPCLRLQGKRECWPV
jgi:hypothetical protein